MTVQENIYSDVEIACQALTIEQAGIADLIDALRNHHEGYNLSAAFEKTIALIYSLKGRVVVTGIGKSGHLLFLFILQKQRMAI